MINFSSRLINDATVKRFVKECPDRFIEIQEKAVNKTAAKLRYLIKKETPKIWGVNKEELKNFKVKRASRKMGEIVAMAFLQSENIPLFRFQKVTPRAIMKGKTAGGVSVELAGQNHTFRHAFVANVKAGDTTHTGIFERSGKYREEKGKRESKPVIMVERITERTTLSTPGMVQSEKTNIPESIIPKLQEIFEDTFIKEAAAWLQFIGAK